MGKKGKRDKMFKETIIDLLDKVNPKYMEKIYYFVYYLWLKD